MKEWLKINVYLQLITGFVIQVFGSHVNCNTLTDICGLNKPNGYYSRQTSSKKINTSCKVQFNEAQESKSAADFPEQLRQHRLDRVGNKFINVHEYLI